MMAKLSEMLKARLMEKGYKHQEEKILKSYRYSGKINFYGGDPTPDENGDKLYEKKETYEVADEMSDEEALSILDIENQKTIDAIKADMEELRKEGQRREGILQAMAENIRIIKMIAIFFAVIAVISIIVTMVQMGNLAAVLNPLA